MKALHETLKHLRRGDTILYPTDTVWGIGCDATNPEAVKKVYALKERDDSKALICLVSGVEMLQQYVKNVPPQALEIIFGAVRPTTIIYNDPINLALNLVAADNTIAIRIPLDPFCRELVAAFGKPVVSTSANKSGRSTPRIFQEIPKAILKDVGYVVNLHQDRACGPPSSILKIKKDGTIAVIRE